MNLDRFTQKAQEAVMAAQELAQTLNHQNLEPIHLLIALLRQEDGIVPTLVTQVSGGTQGLIADLKAELEKHPKVYGSNIRVDL